MRYKIQNLMAITCLSLLLTLNADAIEIVIDKGVEDPIPVAIVPFGWSQSANLPPTDVSAVIKNDLLRSGRFKTMDEKDLPQTPHDFKSVNFRDWRLLGMENLVVGNVDLKPDGSYEVIFRLIDVYKGKQIAGFRIPATKKHLRRTAHEISDIIYEKLIGIRGAFATRIVYITVNKTADGTRRFSLRVADADGFNPKVLLESNEPLLSPAWSPDGRKIAYVSFEGKNSAIYVQDVETGQREMVASNRGINSAPAWSPDGQRLALTLSKDGNPEIYILHLATKALRRVTDHMAIPQIYELKLNDGRPRRLSFDGTYNAAPVYSPDDQSIAVVHGNGGVYRIGLLDTDNGQVTTLTDSRLDESPSFSPNGHMIIYTTTGLTGTALAAVSIDGTVQQRLALQRGEVREPVWGPFLKH